MPTFCCLLLGHGIADLFAASTVHLAGCHTFSISLCLLFASCWQSPWKVPCLIASWLSMSCIDQLFRKFPFSHRLVVSQAFWFSYPYHLLFFGWNYYQRHWKSTVFEWICWTLLWVGHSAVISEYVCPQWRWCLSPNKFLAYIPLNIWKIPWFSWFLLELTELVYCLEASWKYHRDCQYMHQTYRFHRSIF